MIRSFRENLALKIISLATAMMIWSYAISERTATPSRQVVAEVVAVGEPPRGIDVEMRTKTVLVEVSGPRAQLEAIADGSVKAIVDLSTARPGARTLRVIRFVPPPEAPAVTFPPQTRSVEATIRSVIRKRVRIVAEIAGQPPAGSRYSVPKIEPMWADVEGSREAIEKVALLIVRPDVKATGFSGQVLADPVDRQGVTVPGVKVDPPTAHVQIDVLDIDQERLVVVSPVLKGSPAPPYTIDAVVCTPSLVTVFGAPRAIAALESLRTAPVDVEGLKTNTVRRVALELPAGVRLRGSSETVEVNIRLRDSSRPTQ